MLICIEKSRKKLACTNPTEVRFAPLISASLLLYLALVRVTYSVVIYLVIIIIIIIIRPLVPLDY